MLFSHIQLVLEYIINELPCPQCDGSFTTDDVEVLMANADDLFLGVGCPHCDLDMEMEVQLREGDHEPHVSIHTGTPVSREDLSNISEVLSKHRGGLSSFLKHIEKEAR